ncbi:hypothetical protein ACTHAL_001444 [Priestia flexa]
MCDCWMCNQTQEEFDEAFIEWEYQEYCKTSENPLTIEEWLEQLPK